MGTDVHGGFQRRKDESDEWEPVKTKWEMDRDYHLFAILANVRNGHGFAGHPTGDSVMPITSGRGIPDDLKVNGCFTAHALFNSWYGSEWATKDTPEFGEWLGDHSHTHMTIDEILEWPHWDENQVHIGCITIAQWRDLKRGKTPYTWSGMVFASGARLARNEKDINGGTTHVQTEWTGKKHSESAKYFLDEINRLKAENEGYEVRLVIGFDS